MIIEVVMPKMGESLQEGTILKWLKRVGDVIERDEMILEISTDKVDTEVPAPNSGVLIEILAEEGKTVPVGSVIAKIETEANSAKIVKNAPAEKVAIQTPVNVKNSAPTKVEENIAKADSAFIDVVMPKMGESLQEGTILKWLKQVGDVVERDEMILEISTDKVDTEVPAPVGGILAEILVPEGKTVEVGSVIGRISTNAAISAVANSPKAIESEIVEEIASNEKHFYSPVVKEIAKENNIGIGELAKIKGSGIDGRVNKSDILNYINSRSSTALSTNVHPKPSQFKEAPKAVQVQASSAVSLVEQKTSSPAIVQSHTYAITDQDEVIPMDRVRMLIADHMVRSKQTSPHVTSVAEADVTGLVKFREKYKAKFESQEGFKLTYTPFFASAAIAGVKAYPMVNVSVDGTNIIRHKKINLSFATALPDGNLIVPVIPNAEMLNPTGLARAIYDLSNRARAKKLNPQDIQGGTITITNVGGFGSLFGMPVINQPQTAIIGIGAIHKRPIVKEIDGEDVIAIANMIYVSITYDHRVIDGALAGQCLNAICKTLESMNEKTIVL